MVNGQAQQQTDRDWWIQLKDLTVHVFVGVGVFILLAIPAIALDFFNQGIELVEIQRPAASAPVPSGNVAAAAVSAGTTIRVSEPVKLVLLGIEYFILAVDVIFVVAFLANGVWKFLRSLKWA